MSGSFIVSLDCEGKWGMADKLLPYHHRFLTDEALARVYEEIVRLFDRYEIAATFAFVFAFTMSVAERERFAHLFERDDALSGGWLSHFRGARLQGNTAGWFQPRALDVVRERVQHEIACHGFCHRPLSDDVPASEARIELEAAEQVAALKGVSLKTFVYPRNKVGNVQTLVQKGYLGYRKERSRLPGALGRVLSLAEELDVWPAPERQRETGPRSLVAIPAGYFFNWRFGARRGVPAAITVRRWKNLLDRTAAGGGVAHLWLHPHNLITAPDTRESLEEVLAYAAKLAASGRLSVLTQAAYCRRILAARGYS